MNIIGDVKGKDCLLYDDIVDLGGTLCNAAEALLENGASSVTAYITHGVLSGGRSPASPAQNFRNWSLPIQFNRRRPSTTPTTSG
jgi:phosphoribosylpyrophosphate synthetase